LWDLWCGTTKITRSSSDVIITVSYDLLEFSPIRINPKADKQSIHIHRIPAEVDAHYPISVGIEGHISSALDVLGAAVPHQYGIPVQDFDARRLRENAIEKGKRKDSFPESRNVSWPTFARR
jgi:acetolactate synthase I/II/III large subunit